MASMPMAAALNQALDQEMERDESVFLIGEDIPDPTGGPFQVTKGLSTDPAHSLSESLGTELGAEPTEVDQRLWAQEVHAHLRRLCGETLGEKAAEQLRIQYGGSVNDQNARDLFGQPDIDGGLIGGASLKADSFTAICKAAQNA